MDPTAVSILFGVVVLAGAYAGSIARGRLPQHHLDADTQDMVKIGVAFLGTLAALVLGLVVASAKNSFDTKTAEVQQVAAKILQLDRGLRRLGSEAEPARAALRQAIASRIGHLGNVPASAVQPGVAAATSDLDRIQGMVHAFSPKDDAQRIALTKVVGSIDEIEQLLSQVVAQTGSSITTPLLALLVFWFAVIMAGWNLVTPRNGTTLVVNVLCAASLSGAIFLLLQMDQPFGGIIRVSDAPLRVVLSQLAR